jgi:pimeloyl-ACP methyl ester carboxylesterase
MSIAAPSSRPSPPVHPERRALAGAVDTKPPRLRRREIVLADGHRVGLSVCGEGVPLVVVHGIMAEGMLYARTLRRIAGLGFRVIAVDSAGHGRTASLGARGFRWQSYVDLHRRVLDHLGVEQAVLLGHSMGGRIVVDVAAAEPERVLALVPANAAIGCGFDRFTRLGRYVPGLLPLGIGLLGADIASTLVRSRRDAGAFARLAAPSLGDRLRALPSLPAAFVATIGDQGSDHRLRALRAAGVPIIVIHSDRDLAIWYPFARGAAAAAGATLVTVDGGGHSWMLEDPDTLPAMLAELLDGPLGEAIDLRARGGIDDLLAPDALARMLDRPRSRPYRLRPRHRWHVEAPTEASAPGAGDSQQGP